MTSTTTSALTVDERDYRITWDLPVPLSALLAAGVELSDAPNDPVAILAFGVDCDPGREGETCERSITVRDDIGDIARVYHAAPGYAGITAVPPRLRNEARMWEVASRYVTDLDEAMERALQEYREAFAGEE